MGISKGWTGPNTNISSAQGLSRCKVIDVGDLPIAFFFGDDTDGNPQQYSLRVNAADVGATVIKSDDESNDSRLVGIMSEYCTPITTAIYVRDETSGLFVANSAVLFRWNDREGKVELEENDD